VTFEGQDLSALGHTTDENTIYSWIVDEEDLVIWSNMVWSDPNEGYVIRWKYVTEIWSQTV
jgi:hypothetical protein